MFTIGEVISILNETGRYTVESIAKDFIFVIDEHGFELKIPSDQAVKIHHFKTGEVKTKDVDRIKPKSNKLDAQDIPKLDLHYESFDTSRYEASAHEKFTIQMNTFKRFVNDHLKKKTTRILIIHGVGEGRLKSEILSCLRGRKGYDMNDANYSQRGVGASYIDIKISIAEPL
ncbi:MAG: Smr/MutS family protein [Crocinitomicaceae bacterium]|nr:Smr/MutS family protein [Crocinitomicaceae bacterium]OUT69338.1 MAG: hypothetical protein CBB76_08330 [Crocinitomicaceae bacterium TMED16]